MNFTKMQGNGNDYIYINCLQDEILNPNDLAIKLSDRHFGIGSDGLVLLLPSKVADFRMKIFNADGSEAESCGNALRCISKYVIDNKFTDKNYIIIETLAGNKDVWINLDQNNNFQEATVNMGSPSFAFSEINPNSNIDKIINEDILIEGNVYNLTCLSVGNPHAIIYMKKMSDKLENINISEIGSTIENYTKLFPNKINVEFVEILDLYNINMRVWERGSGETLCCGTGASAVVAASVINSLCNRNVNVNSKGGLLKIEYKLEDNQIYMTGPAETVFTGSIN